MGDHFKVISAKAIDDFKEGDEIPTSDLTITNKNMVQFKYVSDDDKKFTTVDIKPGIYQLVKSPTGVDIQATEFSLEGTLETIDNTARIKKEVNTFFNKLDVYKQLKKFPRRSILLFGPPGTGKTQSVKKTIVDLIAQKNNLAVLIWPTSELSADRIAEFLSFSANYIDGVEYLIMIAEDIGGVETYEEMPTKSDLLQLLDGVNVKFKIPTFIIATTNFPQKLMESLADRPGRFDQMIEMPPPPLSQKIALMEFIAQRPLTEEEKAAFRLKGAESFSIAHLNEIVVRSMLHDKTYEEVIKEMIAHTEKFKKAFEKKGSMGITNDFWD